MRICHGWYAHAGRAIAKIMGWASETKAQADVWCFKMFGHTKNYAPTDAPWALSKMGGWLSQNGYGGCKTSSTVKHIDD